MLFITYIELKNIDAIHLLLILLETLIKKSDRFPLYTLLLIRRNGDVFRSTSLCPLIAGRCVGYLLP